MESAAGDRRSMRFYFVAARAPGPRVALSLAAAPKQDSRQPESNQSPPSASS
jgi:hypothetical protein